jgi:hypothetical protein
VTLRIVAQHATIWNGQGEPEELARKNRILDEWCAKVGADPGEIERSAQIFGPQLDKLDEYLAAGITHLICDAGGPDYDLAPLRKLIAWRDRQAARTGPGERVLTLICHGASQLMRRLSVAVGRPTSGGAGGRATRASPLPVGQGDAPWVSKGRRIWGRQGTVCRAIGGLLTVGRDTDLRAHRQHRAR